MLSAAIFANYNTLAATTTGTSAAMVASHVGIATTLLQTAGVELGRALFSEAASLVEWSRRAFAGEILAGAALPAVGPWVNWIGWVATAAFGVSYFAKTPKALRIVQACAAILWISYGFIIHAMPVVVANAIVAGAAVYSSFAAPRNQAAQ